MRVEYIIDGENYISLFRMFTSDAPDGTDFFKNEDLDEPIAPEL